MCGEMFQCFYFLVAALQVLFSKGFFGDAYDQVRFVGEIACTQDSHYSMHPTKSGSVI